MRKKEYKPLFYKKGVKPPTEAEVLAKIMRRRRKILRCAAICSIAMLITAVVADLYSETIGLPGFVRNIISRTLAEQGLFFTAEKIKVGAINGLKMVLLRFVPQ